jgi:uncharacterized protein YdcH (DUF465 family)
MSVTRNRGVSETGVVLDEVLPKPAAAVALASFVFPLTATLARRPSMNQESLIERLMAENEEFRRLRLEHQDHDHELEALRGASPLSAEQEWRVMELKKLKLMAKDRMEAIIRHARVTA